MTTTQTISSAPRSSLGRNLSWFLLPPLTTAVLVLLILLSSLVLYQDVHRERVFPGVSVWGVELGGLEETEARDALNSLFPNADDSAVILTDPESGRQWRRSFADMGVYLDVEATLDAARQIGREGNSLEQLNEQFATWYYGHRITPVLVFDEGKLDAAIAEIAAEIDQPAGDASLALTGRDVDFIAAQYGRMLDRADTRARLLEPLSELRRVEMELLVHQISPRIADATAAVNQVQQITGSPMSFYLQEPLVGVDLERAVITPEQLTEWLRVRLVEAEDGTLRHDVFVDEVAIRNWLSQFEPLLYREPVNARFYFDDPTGQLVLVEPHVNGRSLDVEATLARFNEQVVTSNRSLPFVLKDIVPVAHSNVTAAELGITELVSERTTWFYGSSDARKHNIARAAANFYGIVVAPGEEFSFNHYLGDISEEDGYETGLIIFGGRTIEGVGGGVCQVSTTLFQAVFWAGMPVNERWEHGYQVGYYNDGEGPGMDATVYSPVVDFRFTNNTEHHLLIENYYNEVYQSLTFKIYSTDIGRVVEKTGPFFENVQPPKPDIWEFNDELEPGVIRQVDWAVEGADVTVGRTVYNYLGELLIEDTFVSHYIPWQNIYEYGPGIDPHNLPRNWEDLVEEY